LDLWVVGSNPTLGLRVTAEVAQSGRAKAFVFSILVAPLFNERMLWEL